MNRYKKYEPIDGKWYITKELGSGSFGRVFEIERRDFTNDKSALKIITIPSSQSEVRSYIEENYELDERSVSSYFYGIVEEFTNEFALMTKLKGCNNVVRIEDYDVKEHEDEIGWDIFIRMELLTPMNKYFVEKAPQRTDVVKLGIDICKALEACRKFNIVHRDIKPSNIFISDMGEYKLGDFGISRTLEKTSSGLSKKGTYTYMAPEVFKGEAYGSNVDIYSLGIVMYKILNNNLEPFRAEKTHADEENALAKRLKGEPMNTPANADGELARIILKACAYNPKDRYESPSVMREELEAFLDSCKQQKSDRMVVEEFSEVESDATQGIFGGQVEDKSNSNIKETKEDEELTVGIFGERRNTEPEKTEYEPTRGIFDVEEPNVKVQESEADFETVQAEDKIPSVEYMIHDKIVMIVCSLIIFVVLFAGLWVNGIHPNIEHNDVPNDLQQEVMAEKREVEVFTQTFEDTKDVLRTVVGEKIDLTYILGDVMWDVVDNQILYSREFPYGDEVFLFVTDDYGKIIEQATFWIFNNSTLADNYMRPLINKGNINGIVYIRIEKVTSEIYRGVPRKQDDFIKSIEEADTHTEQGNIIRTYYESIKSVSN